MGVHYNRSTGKWDCQRHAGCRYSRGSWGHPDPWLGI